MKISILILVFSLLSISVFSQDPTVYITNGGAGYSVLEGNSYSFSVNLLSVSATDVIVDVSTIEVSAETNDFTPLSTTVTIPSGQLSSNTLIISTTNDSVIELNEYFKINAIVTSGNTLNTETSSSVIIIDNDTTPTVTVYNSISITEGDGINLPVYLSNPFSSDVSINISTASGSADNSDFVAVSTSITILAGQTTTFISISTLDDILVEGDEQFTFNGNVTTGNTTNTSIVSNITIIDNDIIPTFTISNNTVYEGNNAYIIIQLNRVYNSNIDFQFTTANGTADSNDFNAITTTETIIAGSNFVSMQVPTIDDVLDEPEEIFTVTGTVTTGNTTNTSETASVTIVDNDGLPDFSVFFGNAYSSNSEVEEGQNATFYLSLTHPSPLDTDIQITTTNGSADNLDYTPLTINATIPAGTTFYSSPLLIVPTILDQLQEPNETFNINGQVTSSNTFNNSDSKTIVILDNYEINAQPDNVSSVAEVGNTFQLLDNDTFQGLPVDASTISISLVGTNPIGATVNSLGVLTIPANLSIGYYTLNYEICETANPGSCDTATIIVIVKSPLKVTYVVNYSDFNADGLTSVGDLITYEFTVTNNGNAPITNIEADLTYSPINIIGGPIPSLNAGQIDNTTFTATHILTQEDINFGYYGGEQQELFFKGIYYGYEVIAFAEQQNNFSLPLSDGIKLNAFVDTNGNGTQEVDEINFPLGQFNYEINNDGVIHNLFTSPYYLYESNPTTSYNLNYTVDSDYSANNVSTASYSNITAASGSGITTYNFPITVSNYQDLSINITNYLPPPIPGFYYFNYISYTNNSNVTIPSGTITFTMDNALNLIETFPEDTTITTSGFTYNFSDLQPYQTKYISVKMQVPTLPTVALGQLINNSASIDLLAGDILPLNNTSNLTQTIVGSYDPNEKFENHGSKILHSDFTTDDYLTYTIRFENTGTANAINIKIEDVLDEKLDETTIKMLDASHEYALERVDKNLVWNFYAIDLPPSVENSEIGHGYITFKIKPLPNFIVGDIIPNTAHIYFDFNPAIVTNTWNTEFVSNFLGTTDYSFSNLSVYPIPVKNSLYVSNTSTIHEVQIISVLGKQILTKKINNLQDEIDLSQLSIGIFFLKVISNGQEKTIKFIKE